MNRLFFETSSKISFIALQSFSQTECDVIFLSAEAKTMNGALIETLDTLLQKKSLSISDIDEFFICIGPGSFTGIRLGLSLVKGFSYALKKPLLTLTSFHLYRQLSKTTNCLTALYASKNLYYTAFQRNSEFLFPPRVMNEEEIKSALEKLGNKEKISCISDVELSLDIPTTIIDPKELLNLNFFKELSKLPIKRYSGEAIFSLEPYYLRASQAEASLGIS